MAINPIPSFNIKSCNPCSPKDAVKNMKDGQLLFIDDKETNTKAIVLKGDFNLIGLRVQKDKQTEDNKKEWIA